MFLGEGDQAEVVWECINISDENVENIAKRTDEILREGKSAKRTKKFSRSTKPSQVKYLTRSRFRIPEISTKDKSVLMCPNNCGSSFYHKHTLEKHLKFICGQPLRYKCPYCDMSSRLRNNLNTHIKHRHPDCKNYVIDTCIGKIEPHFAEEFNTSHMSQPTWNEEHEIKILSVSSLAKPEDIKLEFADFKDDSIIKNSSWENKTYICPNNCGHSYKHEHTLRFHLEFGCIKRQFGENQTIDQQNSYHLNDESDFEGYDESMIEVMKIESPDELLNPMAIGEMETFRRNLEGKWLCPNKCGGTFSSRGNLNYHLRTHCGHEPKYECPYCRHRMKQSSNGFTHVKNHHPGSELCLVNTETGEVLRRKKDIEKDQDIIINNSSSEIHLENRNSSGQAETTCHSCGKEFKFGHTLSRHLAEGCGFPPRFKCPYCDYQVRRLSYAFFHVTKNHPGCEIYMVDLITGDSITDPSQIKKEAIEEIVEEKKQLAPNPAFVSRSKKGSKTHPGGLRKRKLMCPQGCGHYFFFKLSLQKHLKHCKLNIKETTNPTRFKCPYCDHSYGHRSSILRHIKTHHPKNKKYAIDTHDEEIVPENVTSLRQVKNTRKQTLKSQNTISKSENSSTLKKIEDDLNSVDAPKLFTCPNKCGSTFEHSCNVGRHIRDNCAKTRRLKCPHCNYRSQKFQLIVKHIKNNHRMSRVYAVDFYTKKCIYSEPTRRPRSSNTKREIKKTVKSAVVEKIDTIPIPKTSPKKSKIQKRFPCPNNCGSSFSMERYAKRHVRFICGKAPRFKCPYCSQACRYQGNISSHIKHRHPGKKIFMIDIMKKKSDNVSDKKLRKQKVDTKDSQEETTKEKIDLIEANDVDNENISQPSVSNISARRKPSKLFNSRKRRWTCPHKCGRSFISSAKLKMHSKTICQKAPPMKCPYCSKILSHSWNFDMHMKHRHPQQIESEEFQKNDNDINNQNVTEDNVTVENASELKTTMEVNDELEECKNLGVDNNIEEMEDNNKIDDIEMEVVNDIDEDKVENTEDVDTNIEDKEESNTTVSSNADNLTNPNTSKKFTCPNNCGSSYTNNNSLKSHLRYTCQKNPRFKCPYCDNCSKQTSNGYAHVKNMHSGREIYLIDIETNKFVCGSKYQPSKVTLTVSENQDSQQIQIKMQDTGGNKNDVGIKNIEAMNDSNDEPDEPDEPIMGNEDELGTSGSADLQKLSTEKDKPFICPNNCGSSFSHEYRLTNHIRDQCGPPRYKCPYCFYITRQPSNVCTHIEKKHPNERIYMIDTDMNQSYDEPGSPPEIDEN